MSDSKQIPQTRARQFARLPPELQLTIFRYIFEPEESYLICQGDYVFDWEPLKSLREQLKPIRLISRLFHDAVTPIIFASIHLHASERSLERAESIANSSLARHVLEIVHHQGTFNNAPMDKAHFLTVLRSHRRRQDYPKDFLISADENVLYENYLLEVVAGRDSTVFDNGRMTALLQKLPRCMTFTTLPYVRGWSDPVTTAYTLRKTGLAYLPNPAKLEPISNPSFLSSMTQWRPRMLNLANFPNESSRRQLHLLQVNPTQTDESGRPPNWAGKLVYVRLNWPENGALARHMEVDERDYVPLLKTFFQCATNLVHLELTHGFDLSTFTQIIPEEGLPKLTRLTMSKGNHEGRWAEPHLYTLIERLSPTLKHLHLDNIQLLTSFSPYAKLTTEGGCLLRLLFNISACTTLESCTGLETVADTKSKTPPGQHFVTKGSRAGKAVILAKAGEAVCGRRVWPEGFGMDHLPMTDNIHSIDKFARDTYEGLWIFSAWVDTVDPWDEEYATARAVDVIDEGEAEVAEEQNGRVEVDSDPEQPSAIAFQEVSGGSKGRKGSKQGKSRIGKISKMFGLKRS